MIRPGDYLINGKKKKTPSNTPHGKVKMVLWVNMKQGKESSVKELHSETGLSLEQVVDALCLLRDRNEARKTKNNLWIPQKVR